VIEARWQQRSFAEGFLGEAVDEFWDDWMRAVDGVLDDDDLVATVYTALGQRRPQSRTRGRLGFPAEVVLRLLLLKHVRAWSFASLEREVRTNLLWTRPWWRPTFTIRRTAACWATACACSRGS
jgi:IS5 family transposase